MSSGAVVGSDAYDGVFQGRREKCPDSSADYSDEANKPSNRMASCRFQPYRPETVD
jgi:hypothetical protein